MEIEQVPKTQAELKEVLIKIIQNEKFYVREVTDLTYDIAPTDVSINVLSVRYDVTNDSGIPELDRFNVAMEAVKEQFFKPF